MKRKILIIGFVIIIAASMFFILKPNYYNASDPSPAKNSLVEATNLIFDQKFDLAQEKLEESEKLGMDPEEIEFWQNYLLEKKAETLK